MSKRKYNFSKNDSLCCSCNTSSPECPWKDKYNPVDGWEAEETRLCGVGGLVKSYFVKECPLYKADERIENELTEGSNE